MRILVVDDDRHHTEIIARGLRKLSYAVDVAFDGDEGLFFAQTIEYDVLVLDLMLPNRSGFDICRILRDGGSDVPVLMLTARDAVSDRVKGLDSGADDYLVKPFDFGELVARVRALLRRRTPHAAPVFRVGDLEVDAGAQKAKRGARLISLTAREFALLETLARNAGRVVSRAEIVERVWSNSFDESSNVIDVYIRRLRQRVDDGEPCRLIHTLRGSGYTLSATDVVGEASDDY